VQKRPLSGVDFKSLNRKAAAEKREKEEEERRQRKEVNFYNNLISLHLIITL
jgi:hypothetical protein